MLIGTPMTDAEGVYHEVNSQHLDTRPAGDGFPARTPGERASCACGFRSPLFQVKDTQGGPQGTMDAANTAGLAHLAEQIPAP